MDSFQKLSPGIRLEIMSHIHSHTTLWRLTNVSPVMWNQFISSLTQVDNGNQEFIQDAMAIIRFNESMGNKEKTAFFLDRWLVKSTSPFTRTGFFIEDDMTKETSTSPTQAYMSLPRITFSSTIKMRVTLDDLTWPEKYRLFRAFFKFEVLMKIYDPRLKHSMDNTYYRENAHDLLKELDPCVHESVICVHAYVEASYGVIFAQLRKTHEAAAAIAETARFCAPYTHLYDIERRKLFVHRPVCLSQLFAHTNKSFVGHLCQIDTPLEDDENSDNDSVGSDIMDALSSTRLPEEKRQASIQFQIYRQRAWIFCDNWRLYTAPLFEHFPSPEDIEVQQSIVEFRYPITSLRERQRWRSTEWQDYWAGRTLEPPPERARNHFWEVESGKNDINDIPHFYEYVADKGLGAF
ncbi:hypothetical protein EDB82DRAFT_477855 [Fusarium venenatum]|uniref:uncharacterized protein n=1 Tax=Fusarium venenatum TaxID=56646 RepID=UPI001D7EF659|nr:hypothetical protein EDB82DRAFT_477855 [Fusarium venenatum]